MPRPRTRNYIEVKCGNCGRPLTRVEERRNIRHFCNQTCYWIWMSTKRPDNEKHRKYSNDELIQEIQRVANDLGYLPTFTQMESFGKIYPSVIAKRFGDWNTALSLVTNPLPRFDRWNIDDVSAEDGSWLSGLIDGEGCFRIARPSPSNIEKGVRSYAPVFTMSLRSDDERCLREVQRIIGFTNDLYLDNRAWATDESNAKPAFKVHLRDVPILAHRLIPILDKYPLRSKKVNDFTLFKMAVIILLNKRLTGRRNHAYSTYEREMLEKLYHALHDIKSFETTLRDILTRYNLDLDYSIVNVLEANYSH